MKNKKVTTQKHYSPRAILVAIGTKIRALKLLQPIEGLVRILRKTVEYSPAQILMDALITILAGAEGICEINTRLRSDPTLPRTLILAQLSQLTDEEVKILLERESGR